MMILMRACGCGSSQSHLFFNNSGVRTPHMRKNNTHKRRMAFHHASLQPLPLFFILATQRVYFPPFIQDQFITFISKSKARDLSRGLGQVGIDFCFSGLKYRHCSTSIRAVYQISQMGFIKIFKL